MLVSSLRLLSLLSLLRITTSIPIPNAQIGDAEVECQDDTIEVIFYTEDTFRGRIFVVGKADEESCVSRMTGQRQTSILINKEKCGATTTRSTDPPGLLVTVKVMLSFHDQFITKVDRGYEISCFYMAAEKTVTYPLTVSTNPLSPFTAAAEMPRCRYEVLDPSTKEPIDVATVGHPLLHSWTCESESPQLWCMRVHSCLVQDDSGTQITVLDDAGCAIDRYLLDNLEYGPGDLHAQKEAHAFKFADKVVLNFECSIRLDIRDDECPVPICEDLGLKGRRRVSRSAFPKESPVLHPDDISVRAQTMQILDVVENLVRLRRGDGTAGTSLPSLRPLFSSNSYFWASCVIIFTQFGLIFVLILRLSKQ